MALSLAVHTPENCKKIKQKSLSLPLRSVLTSRSTFQPHVTFFFYDSILETALRNKTHKFVPAMRNMSMRIGCKLFIANANGRPSR